MVVNPSEWIHMLTCLELCWVVYNPSSQSSVRTKNEVEGRVLLDGRFRFRQIPWNFKELKFYLFYCVAKLPRVSLPKSAHSFCQYSGFLDLQ